MPIPAGVTTATVHHDAPVSFGGDPGRVMARFKPSVNLIWEATGTPLARFFDAVSPANGEPLEVELPHTDQPGFVDGSGNTVNNWHYSVKVVFFKDGQRIGLPARDFQLSSGQSDVDLALIPYGVAVNPTVAPLAYVTSVNGQTGDIEIASLEGPAGPAGPTGATGPTGPAGADGADGVDGLDGVDGAPGATGPAGPQGPAGPAGADGADGAAGPEGPAGPIVPLDSLTDVTAPSPTDGQALVWDAGTSKWINGTVSGGGGASALDDLTDVTTTGVADENVLTYDAGTSTWVAAAPTGGGASALDDLTDVTAPSPSEGQALVWDSTTSKWINEAIPAPAWADVTGKPTTFAPSAHTHPATDVSDSTTVGRAVMTAADAAAARTAIGAGTGSSNLTLGTTSTTAKAGDYQPAAAQISDSTAVGRSVLTATDAAAARTAIGAGSLPVIAKTANYTLTTADDAVTFNGSSLTATIPDPTTCATKVLRIKNLHTTALTIVSAGSSKTIDGAASTVLTQWDKIAVVSDGAQWLIVEGRKPFAVSTTAPTAPINGDVWFDIS
jgi:hypothetical protein